MEDKKIDRDAEEAEAELAQLRNEPYPDTAGYMGGYDFRGSLGG